MKHPGCNLAFTSQRNNELMRAFKRICNERDFIDIAEVSLVVVNTPCSRFWVSEERASAVVAEIIKGRPILLTMSPLKREMFEEIYRRYLDLKELHPDWSVYNLVFEVVNSPAPKFYLTPRSAMEYIYKIKKGHYRK